MSDEQELQEMERKQAALAAKITAKNQAILREEEERKRAAKNAAAAIEQAERDQIMYDQINPEVEKLIASIGPSIKDPKTLYIVFYMMTRTPNMQQTRLFLDSYFRHANKKEGK